MDRSRDGISVAEGDNGWPLNPSDHAVVQALYIGDAVNNAGFIVLVADEQMRYLAVSDAACELLGYSRAELLTLAVPEIVVERTASQLYDQFVRDHAQRGAITLRCKDGRHVRATYDARETIVSRLLYYVSLLTPLDG